MTEYDADRRLFHSMKQAGWQHDPSTTGFTRTVDGHRLWVSWGQAEDALRLAEDGERVQGVAPQSRTVAKLLTGAANQG